MCAAIVGGNVETEDDDVDVALYTDLSTALVRKPLVAEKGVMVLVLSIKCGVGVDAGVAVSVLLPPMYMPTLRVLPITADGGLLMCCVVVTLAMALWAWVVLQWSCGRCRYGLPWNSVGGKVPLLMSALMKMSIWQLLLMEGYHWC